MDIDSSLNLILHAYRLARFIDAEEKTANTRFFPKNENTMNLQKRNGEQ